MKDIMPGALASGILFMIGKFAISFYIGKSHVGSTYGAAGSLVVLLLWVYYSRYSIDMGAEFAKAWTFHNGLSIQPNDYAVALKRLKWRRINPHTPKESIKMLSKNKILFDVFRQFLKALCICSVGVCSSLSI